MIASVASNLSFSWVIRVTIATVNTYVALNIATREIRNMNNWIEGRYGTFASTVSICSAPALVPLCLLRSFLQW